MITITLLSDPTLMPQTAANVVAKINRVGVFNCDGRGRFTDNYDLFSVEVTCNNNNRTEFPKCKPSEFLKPAYAILTST